MIVNEIFYSIQGESTYAGRPCVFVRLTGCNLRCVWCDTTYSFYEGTKMSVDEIMEKVKSYGCPLVEITGGEPLLQREVRDLMEGLLEEDFEVLLETSGSLPVDRVPEEVIRIIDLKPPDSGESDKICWEILDDLRPRDQIKFVISSRKDYEWSKEVIERHKLSEKVTLLMSPVFNDIEYRDIAGWILKDRLRVRMQIQMHKFIFDPNKRGI